jgi:hypothetical protein
MPRPEWRDPAKERRWRRLLQQWRRSGMTGRAFCAEHQLVDRLRPVLAVFIFITRGGEFTHPFGSEKRRELCR